MCISKITTPEELLNIQVEEFNKGNIDFLITLYENDACFTSNPGQINSDPQGIRQAFQNLIDTGCKLEAKTREYFG